MADQHTNPTIAALRKLEASLHVHMQDGGPCAARGARAPALWQLLSPTYWRLGLTRWWLRLRKLTYVAGALGAIVLIGMSALWWRLGSGPIDFDMATPWLTAAINDNFGGSHQVQVGGAQIERDATGHTALRIRDIVVVDSDGDVVATAPKAEVGLAGAALFSGRVRAQRLSLVGAEMTIRIEPDAKVTVFAGSDKRPFVTASASQTPIAAGMLAPAPHPDRAATAPGTAPATVPVTPATLGGVPDLGALLAWIDGLSVAGLDGHDLGEIGFKNGNLVVDDQRSRKKWSFQDINLSLTRSKGGGVTLTVSSESGEKPWMLRATMTPGTNGNRIIDIETEKVSAKDVMLALRLGEGQYEAHIPLSARIRAEVGPDGIPRMLDGRIVADKGFIIDSEETMARIEIDRAEFSLDWDALRHALVMPFQIVSGGNRITLLAQLDVPREAGDPWGVKVTGGTVVLSSAAAPKEKPVILNRFLVRLRADPDKQRIDVEQGEFGNMELGFALSGHFDYAGAEPRLVLGVAGNRMSVAAMKRLWPVFVNPSVRAWVEEHVISGTIERLAIATNAPLGIFKLVGPPIADDGISIEILGSGAEIRAVDGLPPIKDADVHVRITGRTATVNIGRGNIELSPGRKLSIASGVFEVPDTYLDAPPARIRFRVDGGVPAAAELLAIDRLREYSGAPLDPATSRGTVTAQVALTLPLKHDLPPGSSQYTITMDVANFAAERLVMGQKVEAANLRVSAGNQGYGIRGDVKINGVPAVLDYRRPRGTGDADVRVNATLDDAARKRLGLDLNGSVTGAVPVKIQGKVPADESEGRYSVDLDLTQARVDNLLPGWTKSAGEPARATFTVLKKAQLTRFDDVVIEGPRSSVKGSFDLDEAGEVLQAHFPVFSFSEGDKTALRADRGPDGALRVTLRGDVYDGRNFVKSAMSGPSADKSRHHATDVDLDIRLGTVAGHHGETLRGLELKMSRRGGALKSFSVNAKLGRDSALMGDLRDLRGNNGVRQVVYIEAKDAGAFFRFSDIYPKIVGGEMWVAMDPPTADLTAKEGLLNIRDFTVRGEAALDRVVAGANAPGSRPGVEFTRMRVEFTRTQGRFGIREGVVRGPVVGATVEGHIDYSRNDVRMRGTFVPLFGLNNMFGQIPLFGIFLGGGSNEGLVGVTYEVVGPTSAPILRVNPISAVAPGLLRKFFEFPTGSTPQSYADPSR
jgi:hypothetical protein